MNLFRTSHRAKVASAKNIRPVGLPHLPGPKRLQISNTNIHTRRNRQDSPTSMRMPNSISPPRTSQTTQTPRYQGAFGEKKNKEQRYQKISSLTICCRRFCLCFVSTSPNTTANPKARQQNPRAHPKWWLASPEFFSPVSSGFAKQTRFPPSEGAQTSRGAKSQTTHRTGREKKRLKQVAMLFLLGRARPTLLVEAGFPNPYFLHYCQAALAFGPQFPGRGPNPLA